MARSLPEPVARACRRLLSEANRDPFSPTAGCFDRRYWAWKLVDFPEATYQRGVYPLAWIAGRPECSAADRAAALDAALRGLDFAARIQHPDGSFDQAFPHEHSFGATAFLLRSCLAAYALLREAMPADAAARCRRMLAAAADFLCRSDESHGLITNHRAGAVAALDQAAQLLGEPRWSARASALLDPLLASQSAEGWFPEYGGADPGYQTLAVHYLALAYRLRPGDTRLREALGRAVEFLAWCVHPDRTLGGAYGSRRTAVFYPGGLALLAPELPLADSILRFMLGGAEGRCLPGLDEVDAGLLPALLESWVTALEAGLPEGEAAGPLLPWQSASERDFPGAGLHFRAMPRYYAVFGASNGGVLRVFDVRRRRLAYEDAGYAGETRGGTLVTTQSTDLSRAAVARPRGIELETGFRSVPRPLPTPAQFLVLRTLNLTLMRFAAPREWMKRLLVRHLMGAGAPYPMTLRRRLDFEDDAVRVTDTLRAGGRDELQRLECPRWFSSIHMAAAGFWTGPASAAAAPPVDLAVLGRDREETRSWEIRFDEPDGADADEHA